MDVEKIKSKLTPDEVDTLETYYLYVAARKPSAFLCKAEIIQLNKLVDQYGTQNWKAVAKELKCRTPKQCREAYFMYSVKSLNGPWTPEEDQLLIDKYKEYGSKWLQLQSFFPNRTDTNLKNRWLSLLRKPGLIEILPTLPAIPSLELPEPILLSHLEPIDETMFWS